MPDGARKMNTYASRMHLRFATPILVLVALVGVGCGGDANDPVESAQGPSLLLVVMDTLRADRLGLYGYPRATSPVLDDLAASALVYEQAISTAPFTMPSMASVFTGLYPDRTGVNNHEVHNSLHLCPSPTLAELAQRAGYRTEAVVTNGWLSDEKMGFNRGFSGFQGGMRSAKDTTDRALTLLADIGDAPFALWVHYIDQHMPYQPPSAFAQRRGVASGTSQIVEDFRLRRIEPQDLYFSGDYPAEELEATRELYDATIAYTDEQLGRLLQGLETAGRAEDTIVVVLSDHGESLGDHGLYFAHDFALYDELIRVALLVRVPGIQPARIQQQVSLVDVLPGLCGWMDLECPEGLDGRALPVRNSAEVAERTVFAASAPHRDRYSRNPRLHVPGIDGRWTMARNGSSKLIKIPHPDGSRWEFYDLRSDPAELNNMPDHPDADALRTALLNWEKSVRSSRIEPALEALALDPDTIDSLRWLGYVE